MTAMNAFARQDGAWLLSDSAWFANDGTVMMRGSKFASCDRLRVAIGWNGTAFAEIADEVEPWLARRDDVSDVLANLPALAASIDASMAGADHAGLPEGLRLTLAYWDAHHTRGRVVLIASNAPMGDSIGREPFEVRHVTEIFTPRLDPSPWPRTGDFNPRRDGKRLAKLQRKAREPDGTHRVGGTFTALRVHADGIEQFEITRWWDPVGVKIIVPRWPFRWPFGQAER